MDNCTNQSDIVDINRDIVNFFLEKLRKLHKFYWFTVLISFVDFNLKVGTNFISVQG